ncbi:MAG TPA: nucleoside deaminase, partial [Bacteroidaceae bacterium]|nr:nucleoside deaminase [Bacteroidaceae bacterium]
DVTAHAEMIAITSAANYLGAKYLLECCIYVTLEPCLMCASALAWSQIDRIVYGTSDPKAGFSKYGIDFPHPKTTIHSGLLEHECSNIIKQFFVGRRDMQ